MKIDAKRSGLSVPDGREVWLRGAVITVTLLAAAYIGLHPSSQLTRLFALAPLGLLALLILLRYLPVGVIGLAPVAFLVDWRIVTGTKVVLNATFLMLAFLIGVWFLRMTVIQKRLRPVYSPANLPALLFIAACSLAWLISFLPWMPLAAAKPSLPAQLGAYLLYVLSISGFLLAANTLNSLRLIKLFTWIYLALAIVYLLAIVISRNETFVYRWLVDAQYGQSVYWTLLTALTAGQGLFNRGLKWPLRAGLLAIAGLTIGYAMIYRSSWISGWLPPLITLVLLIWLRNWRVGLAVSLAGLVFSPIFNNYLANHVNDSVQQWSTFTRFATWPIVFKLISANPITGLGPAIYPFYTPLFSYLGYFIEFNSHNNYFDIALQHGLIGLALFGWLVVVVLRLGWKVRQTTVDGFSQGYANAMLAGLAAILISGAFSDWFLPFVYNIGIPGFQGSIFAWLFAGGLVSLSNLNIKRVELSD